MDDVRHRCRVEHAVSYMGPCILAMVQQSEAYTFLCICALASQPKIACRDPALAPSGVALQWEPRSLPWSVMCHVPSRGRVFPRVADKGASVPALATHASKVLRLLRISDS